MTNGGGMTNGGMMIGMNGSAFHLESGNKPFKSSNTYYSSLMEKSQRKTLESVFNSPENKSRIISRLDEKKYNFDEKKCNIEKYMIEVIHEHENSNIYNNTKSQNDVLNNLNKKVVEKCIKNKHMNRVSYAKYIKDVTTLAPLLSHPKSTNNSSTLEFKNFF